MTRLDSVIRRLMAQRAVLDWAAREVARRPGPVLELGLGNGRTYDHLRDRLPGRDIYVFERMPAAHPDCMPSKDRLVVGDICETLPAFIERIGPGRAVLIHADIGTGDQAVNQRLADRLSPFIEPLLAPGGLLVADRPFELPNSSDVSGEAGVEEGRYYVFRRNEDGRSGPGTSSGEVDSAHRRQCGPDQDES
jgi:hypothetical protein